MSGSHLPIVVGLAPCEPHDNRTGDLSLTSASPSSSHSVPHVVSVVPIEDGAFSNQLTRSASGLVTNATQSLVPVQGSRQQGHLVKTSKSSNQDKIAYLRKIIFGAIKKQNVLKLKRYWQIAKENLKNDGELISSFFIQLDADRNNALLLAAKHKSLECLRFCFEEMKQSLNDRNAKGEDILRVAHENRACMNLIVQLAEQANEQGIFRGNPE